jgi:serine/threonine-protein kinase
LPSDIPARNLTGPFPDLGTSVTSLSPEFLALQALVAGRYVLERELGRGGMGVVYLAREVALDRPVAIKVLDRALARSPEQRERFLNEARTAAALAHPHIVPIHAVEAGADPPFFVMEYVDGESLGARLRRLGPVPVGDAVRILLETAWALGHAHARGVIHRDVKPENILLEDGSGRAVVTDFGIARRAAEAVSGASGTPRFMSPEQAAGAPPDARADVYALGRTAWFILSGGLPEDGAALPAATPDRLRTLLEQALDPDPDRRPSAGDAMAAALRDVRAGGGTLPVPLRRFAHEIESSGNDLATTVTAGLVSTAIFRLVVWDDLFGGIALGVVVALFGTLTIVRLGRFLTVTRDFIRQGYGHQAARVALAVAEQERAVLPALREPRWRRWLGALGLGAAGMAAVVLGTSTSSTIVGILGMGGGIAAVTAAVSRLWQSDAPGRGVWQRKIAGPVGALMFRVMGLGLTGARRPVAGEPTAVALGEGAQAAWAALAEGDRRRLAEVPSLVARLEARAARVRGAGETPADPARFTAAVTALETLRLDLWRLQAGAITAEDLTADLEAVRRIGEEIDAAMEGKRIVGEVLRSDP